MSTNLKAAILEWLSSQPLRPPRNGIPVSKQPAKKTYFAIVAGVRKDFKELKIHLSRHPEFSASLAYAESKTFSLEGMFSKTPSRTKKVKKLGEVLQQVALDCPIPAKSNCVPVTLMVETMGSKTEPFYRCDIYPCGLGGTAEADFAGAYIGICGGYRHELVVIGKKNLIAVSLEYDNDKELMQAIELNKDYEFAEFGNITLMKARSKIASYKKSGSWLRVKWKDGTMDAWMVDHPSLL